MKEYKKDYVDIITLNYNGKDILPLLLDSLKKITYKNHSITMVDNGSNDGSTDFVKENYPEVNLIESKVNLFFSRGNNLAVGQTNGEFILLINNDIVVEPDFLDHMVSKIKEDKEIAAVAAKMMLYHNPTVIDSVGVVMAEDGSPFNRGIGQVDLGQYDESQQIFGACFGCVLLRREYYEGEIGMLDNMYFGYFEDVDWSFRANMLGYKIFTEPKAVVYHAHSVTSRKNVPMWKFYLIQRNFIWTIQKNFERMRFIKRTIRRYQFILKNMSYRESFSEKMTLIKLILETVVNFPRILIKRFDLQKRRIVWDQDIFRFSKNEFPFFEDINYKAVYTLDNLEQSLRKVRSKSPELKDLYRTTIYLNREKDHVTNKEWEEDVTNLLKTLQEKKYIVKDEIENFRKDILIDRIWDINKQNNEKGN